MEVKMSERGGGELTVFTVEEGKVAVVHPDVMERFERSLGSVWGMGGLFKSLSGHRVGRMFVNEVRFEVVSFFEQFGTEETIVAGLVLASVPVVMGPTRFGGDE
jgi:hypothetical protein